MIVSYSDKANVVSNALSRKVKNEKSDTSKRNDTSSPKCCEKMLETDIGFEYCLASSRRIDRSELMIQTLEDILRHAVIDFGGIIILSIECASFEVVRRM
ncbi:hypothetical protein Tco_1485753 [Tanacetum coccineum]